MSFSAYLRQFIRANSPLLENTGQPGTQVIDYTKIKNQIESKIGGELSDKNAVAASFEAIESSLDSIPLAYFENADATHLDQIFDLLTEKNRIDFVEKFTEEKKKAVEDIANSLDTLDRDKDEIKFIQYLKSYTDISERLLKIYRLFAGQTGELNEAKTLAPEETAKVSKIIKLSKEGAAQSFKKILDQEKKNIESIPDTPDGESVLFKYKDLIEFLGLSQLLKKSLAAKEETIKTQTDSLEKSADVKNKKRLVDRLIRAVNISQLPAINNELVETNGGYWKLFNALKKRNPEWMRESLTRYVFAGDSGRMMEFENTATAEESPKEEDQLTYLRASASWIRSYIELKEDGNLPYKDSENLKSALGTALVSREKAIKNYYLSKEFNLGNFGGIQIKPEIRLPLHAKVKLAVSEEDRKKESPLSNVLKGLGQIITGLFSSIPDRGNEQIAQARRQEYIAIFNGLNSIIKGTVTAIGGKQAGRDYAEKTDKLFGKKEKTKGGIREDMLSVADSPGFVAVNPESPGQMMQSPASLAGGMDTFSLLGPGKKAKSASKKKKSKPKKPKLVNQVTSFADFMQRK